MNFKVYLKKSLSTEKYRNRKYKKEIKRHRRKKNSKICLTGTKEIENKEMVENIQSYEGL